MIKYWVLATCITIASSFIPLFVLWLITGSLNKRMIASGKIGRWILIRRIFLSLACGVLMIPHVQGGARDFIGPGWWYLTRPFNSISAWILVKMALLAVFIFAFKTFYDSRKKISTP